MLAAGLAVACFAAASTAFGVSLVLARNGHRHERSLDSPSDAPQKLHAAPVPRVGGVALAAGLLAACLAATLMRAQPASQWLLVLCVVPGFAWGLIEDFAKRGGVFARLAISGCSAMLAFVLLDARITELKVPLLDGMLAYAPLSFAFTIFAVTGVGHSMNVIDGLNGLSGVTALLASIGFAVVAWTVGDEFIVTAACVLAAAVAGFLVVNYPRGEIFLGDGGAYLLGLALAEISVLLVQRNPEVSPWFPLVLLAYPIWETLFSMYRRSQHRVSTGKADALHLHSLVYRRMVHCDGSHEPRGHCATRNSAASLVLWVLPALCSLAAVGLWNRTLALQAAAAAFATLYVLVYLRIVRFQMPKAFVVRLSAEQGEIACPPLPRTGV